MRYDTILFDLDGTLTDPADGICRSIKYALEKAGLPVEPKEAYHKWIGPPLADSFQRFAHVSPEQAETLVQSYRERFSVTGMFENEVYPGIPELLETLCGAGCRLLVATSKPTVFARQILDHFGLLPRFLLVSGTSLKGRSASKEEVIETALLDAGITDRRRCVMVGDRFYDTEAAARCGLDSIGVLYGYGSPEELKNAVWLAPDPASLGAFLLI
ncbi:MAG: HAD hydrolase-like protein [Oscillospiraceae bacterium]|nr:HAD hydrolase-like protein [Oscillospiraceae bacterium]